MQRKAEYDGRAIYLADGMQDAVDSVFRYLNKKFEVVEKEITEDVQHPWNQVKCIKLPKISLPKEQKDKYASARSTLRSLRLDILQVELKNIWRNVNARNPFKNRLVTTTTRINEQFEYEWAIRQTFESRLKKYKNNKWESFVRRKLFYTWQLRTPFDNEILDDSVAFFWFRKRIIVIPQPAVARDTNQRLHNLKGPALLWENSVTSYEEKHYFVRGIYLTRDQVIKHNVTKEQILRTWNAEERRALMEVYGLDKFFKDIGAKVLDSQKQPGTKYINQVLEVDDLRGSNNRTWGGPDKWRMLKLHCPTTGRVYMIRVNHNVGSTETVKGALAFSYRLPQNIKYKPIQET